MDTTAVVLEQVSKSCGRSSGRSSPCRCPLQAKAGEFLAIMGPSRCGKNTLLNLIAGIGRPRWKVTYGHDLSHSDDKRNDLRLKHRLCFPELQPPGVYGEENVAVLEFMGSVGAKVNARQRHMAQLGIERTMKPAASELSEVSNRSRYRAGASGWPKLPWPMSRPNLDSQNGQMILDLLQRLNQEQALTVLWRLTATLPPPLRTGWSVCATDRLVVLNTSRS
jgi:ABC-type lipoprotein export system ATPase subunit